MNYILFDDDTRGSLLPFTYTRPIADIRIGILTIREKWERHLSASCSTLTESFLSKKFPVEFSADNTFINGTCLPNAALVAEIRQLKPDTALRRGELLIAVRMNAAAAKGVSSFRDLKAGNDVESNVAFFNLRANWDIFSNNEAAIGEDFKLLTAGRTSQAVSASNQVMHPENIFLEAGARVECAILNASAGPIYIGRDAEVMEGAMIRGPFSLGDHAQVKMGAKIYGATTIGPECRVGGEVNNSVIFGYSNKAHDGFLGNSVIGEWCNLGADSNNSNLKNNYSQVKVWDYRQEAYVNTGLQFCGLIMGDHSKCGINTMFNTGTVVGVSANIFGTGFPQKFIPSFSWGGGDKFVTYRIEEAIEVAERVYERRKKPFDDTERELFTHLFDNTTKYRSW